VQTLFANANVIVELNWNEIKGAFTHLVSACVFRSALQFFYNLPWLSKTKVSYKKSQRNAVNACENRMCKLSFTLTYHQTCKKSFEKTMVLPRWWDIFSAKVQSIYLTTYRVCLGLRLTKQDDYLWVNFLTFLNWAHFLEVAGAVV